MKVQLIIVGLIFSVVFIAGCTARTVPIGWDDKHYDIAEVTNASCNKDSDCITPDDYLIRSSCPFFSKCLEHKCNVVCPKQLVGNDRDKHGCIPSAGYSWCEEKQKCLRTWEENCTAECGTCPLLSQPAPGWCANGTIVAGNKDECGCQSPPKCLMACTEEAKLCPDGTAVGRNSENNCEFDPCPNGTGIANPASQFCILQGGESKIITAADGSQSGVCTLPYGIECDEWAYFRGECPASVNCTAEQKAAEVCTMEYMPVCGDDGVTYGNKCSACASKNIDSYVPGECPQEKPSTCGNGVCDSGEANQCPACYYSTPPCLAPCTAGTCPEDCVATTGN